MWSLAAGSAVFWGLRLGENNPSQAVAATGDSLSVPTMDAHQVALALGAGDEPAVVSDDPDLISRLTLLGVLTHGAHGAVLVAIDGEPARLLRVGDELEGVDGGWMLDSVAPHAALLVADGRQASIEMPAFDQRSRSGDAVALGVDRQDAVSAFPNARGAVSPGRIGGAPMRVNPGVRRQ